MTKKIEDFDKWARYVSPETIIKSGKERRPGFHYGKAIKKLISYYKMGGYGVSEILHKLSGNIKDWNISAEEAKEAFKYYNVNKKSKDWADKLIMDRIYKSTHPIEFAQETTKQIKSTSIKLPKKKLKLENTLQKMVKEING